MCNEKRIKYCRVCTSKLQRKVTRPSKEELYQLLIEKPILKIAKEYGVSDSAVIKWCKTYKLERPGRGHWEKIYHNK